MYICIYMCVYIYIGFPCGSAGKSPAMQETWVPSLGWEDPLEKGKANPLQYTDLENSMNCIVHGVAKSWTRLSDFHFTSLHTYMTCKFVKRSIFFRASLVAQLVKNPPAM